VISYSAVLLGGLDKIDTNGIGSAEECWKKCLKKIGCQAISYNLELVVCRLVFDNFYFNKNAIGWQTFSRVLI